jgi:hypothetical protein
VKIARVMRLPISTADVFAMSCTPQFQERKCADAGALSWDVTVIVDGDSAPIILSVIDAEEATGKAWVAEAV